MWARRTAKFDRYRGTPARNIWVGRARKKDPWLSPHPGLPDLATAGMAEGENAVAQAVQARSAPSRRGRGLCWLRGRARSRYMT